MRRLRWGVIGTANIGRAVNPAIHASTNGELVAVASRDIAKARAYAEQWRIPRAHGSYDALLADTDVDAVYIPLPNSLHREWTIRAAERGKHILCEKPLALNAAECHEMQRAADANGVQLMEAFMYRFHPRTEHAVALARSGALGTVRAIRSMFTFKLSRANDVRLDATLGGGAVMDVGCYCINISRTIAGAEPVEAQAWARWGATGIDMALTGVLRFADGLLAHFDCAMDLERREMFDVAGTDASITVDHAFAPGAGDLSTIEHRAQREDVRHEFKGIDQYLLMVEHFADAALNGTPLRYSAAEAAANMAVIEALLRSARSGGVPVALARSN